MFITLTEVVENSTKTHLASSDPTDRNKFTLREVTINPEYVVCVREDVRTRRLLEEGQLPEGLDSRQRFTRVYMDRGQSGIDIVVVGDPESVQADLKQQRKNKQVLNG